MIASLIKGALDSLFGWFMSLRSERSKERAAETKAENERLKKNIELRKQLAEDDKERKDSDNLRDSLDRFSD